MADGELKLELGDALSERLKVAAAAEGLSPEAYATELIADCLDEEWAVSYARAAEYERTGEYLDAEAEMKRFQQAVAERFNAKQA
jgi:hypothetical protein